MIEGFVTVKIPGNADPYRVIVNGVEHIYPANATVYVPEEVAAVIAGTETKPSLPELEAGSGDVEGIVIRVLSDLQLVRFASVDGTALYTDNDGKVFYY